MMLRGINFRKVWCASGALNFFGEGYWFHKHWRRFGLDFDKATFVAKTTTFNPNKGNMPLDGNYSPKELSPKCIIVKPFEGVVLNSVGLSGPGAKALFEEQLIEIRWQDRIKPFFISFMPIAKAHWERIEELRQFVDLFGFYKKDFLAPVGLQINFSCPNVGLRPDDLIGEIDVCLAAAAKLKVPLVPKISLEVSMEAAVEISKHPECDAICVSNSIPWGRLPGSINWEGIFGSKVSPLAHLGGGGLSGEPLLSLIINWLKCARRLGLVKPINAGGGILSKKDAKAVLDAGGNYPTSIFLGSVALLRPWRVKGITRL